MAAGKLDLTIEQGATFQRVIAVTQNGSALNLTGYTARMQIRETIGSSTTIANLTSSDALSINGAAGTITITISAIVTAAMTFAEAVYDLEIESGGIVTRLLQGEVALSKEVTR